jgi:hypothetical protein
MREEYKMLAIGSLESQDRLEELLRQLKAAGFSTDAISVAAADHQIGSDPADEPPREGGDRLRDMVVGAASGGVVLGTVTGLIGLASLTIPGLGLFLVGGPLAVALGDALAGGAVGAVAGALMGMRIPDHQAKQYEQRLRQGAVLVSVHAREEGELNQAMKIMAGAGASDLNRIIRASSSRTNSPVDSLPGESLASPANKEGGDSTKSSKHRPQQPSPEGLEEAEQDAGDPTHEKKVPPR